MVEELLHFNVIEKLESRGLITRCSMEWKVEGRTMGYDFQLHSGIVRNDPAPKLFTRPGEDLERQGVGCSFSFENCSLHLQDPPPKSKLNESTARDGTPDWSARRHVVTTSPQ
jgi:hypothetical protein